MIMKKWAIRIGIGLIVIAGAIWGFVEWNSESLPDAKPGAEAEALADRMLEAVNKEAWDSLGYIQWSFMDRAHYVWDKQNHKVQVKWDDVKVLLDPDEIDGMAWEDGREVEDPSAYLEEAFERFCNDAFWMNAFVKVRDPGTRRGLVEQDGRQGLLVTYESGGVTPGDSYLWWLDETGRPESFQMWVSIVPVGGMEFSFEEWDTLYNGALVAKQHQSSMMNVEIKNIKAGASLESMGLESDIFGYFATAK